MSHYKPYPAYKDSGVKWLGEVPEHWEIKPLKWLIDRNDGGVWGDDPSGEFDTIVLRSTEQTVDGEWRIDAPAYRKISSIDKEFALLKEGDLLLTKSSGSSLHIGKTSLVTSEIEAMQCCYSNFMQRIRLKSNFHPKLAWFIMNNELARSQFDYLSSTTTGLANLNGSMIGSIFTAIPPLAEQQWLVEFLDRETTRIDTLIAKKTRFIELLKEKRQALITQAVTKGLNPNVKMKDSGVEWLGEVPEHWALNYLSHIARFSGGGTPNRDNPEYWNGSTPWISPKDMKTEFVIGAEEYITEKGLKESSSSLVPAGRILLVVRSGILKHTIPVAINLKSVALNQDMKAVHFDIDRMEPLFFMRFVQGKNDDLLDAWLKQGATVESIEQDYLARTLLPVPPICEQQLIIEFLAKATERVDGLMSKTQLSINLLKERRSALITAAVTGQIDLREAA